MERAGSIPTGKIQFCFEVMQVILAAGNFSVSLTIVSKINYEKLIIILKYLPKILHFIFLFWR